MCDFMEKIVPKISSCVIDADSISTNMCHFLMAAILTYDCEENVMLRPENITAWRLVEWASYPYLSSLWARLGKHMHIATAHNTSECAYILKITAITSTYWKRKYRDCWKSTGDKTWHVSKTHEIGHWENIIVLNQCLVSCVILKTSSKPYIVVHSHHESTNWSTIAIAF